MTPEGLAEVSDAELLGAHRRPWHPRNASKPIEEWSLAELDAAAALCDRLIEELIRRGLLSSSATALHGPASHGDASGGAASGSRLAPGR